MCKRLLKHTNNNFLQGLCYDIIREQEAEIFKMNEMLEGYERWQYDSPLL